MKKETSKSHRYVVRGNILLLKRHHQTTLVEPAWTEQKHLSANLFQMENDKASGVAAWLTSVSLDRHTKD